MRNFNFRNKILLSITGEGSLDWANKLEEINELKIKKVAVFLERFDKKERDNFYRLLGKSCIKEIPFVHLRHDVGKKEMDFFVKKYKTKYFNIHEDHFKILDKWKGYWDKIYLEMNYDSKIDKDVKVRRIGGFCIDLSHFKASIARGTEEAYYTYLRKNKIKFTCNHLNGYNSIERKDKHIITSLKDFDYLTSLPKYVFGELISIEIDNSIKEQISFKEYLIKLLNDYFLQKEK
ncbi:MAG: hypothetical protein ABIA08_02230 [bacterium]